MNLLCKLFGFVLKIFGMVVDFAADTVVLLGSAVVDVLGELIDEVADSLGLGSGTATLLKLGLLGLGAYWLFGLVSDDDEVPKQVNQVVPNQGGATIASQPDF